MRTQHDVSAPKCDACGKFVGAIQQDDDGREYRDCDCTREVRTAQHTTKVVFRRYPEGDIIALFPDEPGTRDPATCMSYQTLGQHGAADYAGVIMETKPATAAEHAALTRELLAIGYTLRIAPRAMGRKRAQATGGDV